MEDIEIVSPKTPIQDQPEKYTTTPEQIDETIIGPLMVTEPCQLKEPAVEKVVTQKPVLYDTLVLSGCSTKGIVTLGSVQYLYDNYFLKNISTYIGTSSGAIIVYLLAIGYTPVEIMVYICTNQLMEKLQHLNIIAMIQGNGASSFSSIQEQIEKMTISKIGYLPTLNDLKEKYGKTLICVTYNITENHSEYLSYETYPNLPCITALRMSANLPLIFENYKYGNSSYIDGGISDNFAIDIAENFGNKILGIVLDEKKGNISNDSDINTIEFMYKLMFIPISQATEYKISLMSDKCDIIRLQSNDLKFFQFNVPSSTKMEMFSSGYKQTKDSFELPKETGAPVDTHDVSI